MGLHGGATAVLLELKVSPKLFGVGERRTNGNCQVQGEDSKVEIGVPWTKRAEDTYEQCSKYLGTDGIRPAVPDGSTLLPISLEAVIAGATCPWCPALPAPDVGYFFSYIHPQPLPLRTEFDQKRSTHHTEGLRLTPAGFRSDPLI